jgi:hypothetical protein
LKQLFFSDEIDSPWASTADNYGIQVASVIRNDQTGSRFWKILPANNPKAAKEVKKKQTQVFTDVINHKTLGFLKKINHQTYGYCNSILEGCKPDDIKSKTIMNYQQRINFT